MIFACSTARSCSGCTPMTTASDSRPSWNTTWMRFAPCTTCRFVKMMPVSTITTPVPLWLSALDCTSASGASGDPRTWTTEGRMLSYASAAVGAGCFASSTFCTMASTSACVIPLAGASIQRKSPRTNATATPAPTLMPRAWRLRHSRKVMRGSAAASALAAARERLELL